MEKFNKVKLLTFSGLIPESHWAYKPNKKKKWKAIITLKLKGEDFNHVEFTASGDLYINGKPEMGGQIEDDIKELMGNDESFDELYLLWKRWHLNYLRPGTKKQIHVLKQANLNNQIYDVRVAYLKERDLYNDNGVIYGAQWMHEELPDKVKLKILELMGLNYE